MKSAELKVVSDYKYTHLHLHLQTTVCGLDSQTGGVWVEHERHVSPSCLHLMHVQQFVLKYICSLEVNCTYIDIEITPPPVFKFSQSITLQVNVYGTFLPSSRLIWYCHWCHCCHSICLHCKYYLFPGAGFQSKFESFNIMGTYINYQEK